MNIENLIALRYLPKNNSCVEVIPIRKAMIEDKNIALDINKEKWQYPPQEVGWRKEFKIGSEMRNCKHDMRSGVIGIYDYTEIAHLNTMIHHATNAVAVECFGNEY